MSKILFGTPKIEYAESVNGTPVLPWLTLDMPKEGTATLETSEGTKTEAKGEDGKTVDSYTDPGTSTLSFELFKKKGLSLPFPDSDGVISKEYAFRVTSSIDPSAPAFQIDRASLVANRAWSKTDAYRVAYTATALEPASGAMVKDLGVDLSEQTLTFTASTDNTGKTVDVENSNGTVSVTTDDTWITASHSDGTITIKVSANTGTQRTGVVTVTDTTGFSAQITVVQAAPESGE